MAERYDVAILGGGLAGLTAALQIKRARPETSVLLLEKRKGPAPLAAFKVGESTLELSAHYFANVLDLHDHLDAEHVHKPALRYFFTAGDNRDVTRRVEWGPPGSRAEAQSFQIDRGRFENELADRCRAQGVDLRDGARVEDVDLHPATSTIRSPSPRTATRRPPRPAGWLARPAAPLSSGGSSASRGPSTTRSTRHGFDSRGTQDRRLVRRPGLAGADVRLHPLDARTTSWARGTGSGSSRCRRARSASASSRTRFHPFERINTLEAALDWLDEHEPVVADAIRSRPDDVEDFLKIEHYSHGTERMFSPDRWG